MTNVMIIDDDERWSEDTAEYLRSEGIEVIIQTKSHEGIRLVKEESYDVLIIDYKLINGETNKDDGIDVINKIRENDNFIPIIFCSGQLENWDMDHILIEAINLGIAEYFSKSKSASELQKIIKKCEDFKTDSILSTYEKWYKSCTDKDTPIIVSSRGEKYSPRRIIDEIKRGTPLGIELRKDLADFALECLIK
ncbi:MAG: response regulator [Candidatus Methanoperedens sp.]|nr:response regulator [Candidatus Methanoperedens sp.]